MIRNALAGVAGGDIGRGRDATQPGLSRIYLALADPTRREMISVLCDSDGLTVGALAAPFAMSLPAAIKHIDVLCDSGIVQRVRVGRHVHCHLRPEPLAAAMGWLERQAAFGQRGSMS